jgi:single-stranded-DNA-specific exonuclease
MPNGLSEAMAEAVERLRSRPASCIDIFHHNDSDGLTSGAILTRSLERAGFSARRVCLEKPYPLLLEKILAADDKIIIFADFAGRIAPLIAKLNNGRNLVLILDHHKAMPVDDGHVLNLDPELFGIRGDLEISASTTCYRFACIMSPVNRDLAALAAVGAVGDGFFLEGKLTGPNREAALEAASQGSLVIDTNDGGETYLIKTPRGLMRCDAMGEYLDTLGGAGYSRGGPEMGVRVCLEGFSEVSDTMAAGFRDIRKSAFSREMERILREGMHETAHIQWLDVGENFRPMGVKMIGVFLDELKSGSLVDNGKYLAGFMNIPGEIPGMGQFKFKDVKVSMRVPPAMEENIRTGSLPGLNTFLPEATARLDGFSDACHSLTAATTVAAAKQGRLIAEMEKILSNKG